MSEKENNKIRAARDEPKTRRCLRCRESFSSEWSGERICGRCKKSKDWRSGGLTQARSVSPGGRR